MPSVTLNCTICGKIFRRWKSALSGGIYCSKKCYGKSISNKVKRECRYCGQIFEIRESAVKHRGAIYCSKQCHGKAKSRANSIEVQCKTCDKSFYKTKYRSQRDQNHYCSKECFPKAAVHNCEICDKEFKTSNHFVRLGRGRFCSRKCYGLSERGPNNLGWKDDKYPEYRKARNSRLFREWRDKVFARDEGKCRKCDSGENLRGHHLFSFTRYPDLRFDVSNGITFCDLCHLEFHIIYGRYDFSPLDTFMFLGYNVGGQQVMIFGLDETKQYFNQAGIT